jgi:diguanylate cyclase (GGDEF)-like protein/PAS domain S-box-containing protein
VNNFTIPDQSSMAAAELAIKTFEQVDIAISLWTAPAVLHACNACSQQWMSLPRDQMMGTSVQALFGDAIWQQLEPHFRQAFSGEASTYDRLATRSDGVLSWLRVKLTPAVWERGKVTAIFATSIAIDDHVRSVQTAQLGEARVQRVLNSVDMPIGCWDADAQLIYCNEPYLQWARRGREALLGRTLSQLYGPDAWQAAQGAFALAFKGEKADYTRMIRHHEYEHWMRITVFPDFDADGRVSCVYTIAFDIDAEVRAIDALENSRKKLDALAANIPHPMTYFDRDFVYRFVNKAFAQRHRLDPQQVVGRTVQEVRGDQVWQEHLPYLQRALSGSEARYERQVTLADGGKRWTRSSYMPDMDESGNVRGIYSSSFDIDELKLAQEALRASADRDPLTDVFNRRYLVGRLDAWFAGRAANESGSGALALVFVDLDGFKRINDEAGHPAGDAALKTVAQRLAALVPENGLVARFGGDEFVLLSFDCGSAALASLADHVVAAASMPLGFEKHKLVLSASAGIALAPAHANTALTLLKRADEAMYCAKRAGKNGWAICQGPDAATVQTAVA